MPAKGEDSRVFAINTPIGKKHIIIIKANLLFF